MTENQVLGRCTLLLDPDVLITVVFCRNKFTPAQEKYQVWRGTQIQLKQNPKPICGIYICCHT